LQRLALSLVNKKNDSSFTHHNPIVASRQKKQANAARSGPEFGRKNVQDFSHENPLSARKAERTVETNIRAGPEFASMAPSEFAQENPFASRRDMLAQSGPEFKASTGVAATSEWRENPMRTSNDAELSRQLSEIQVMLEGGESRPGTAASGIAPSVASTDLSDDMSEIRHMLESSKGNRKNEKRITES